MAESEQIDPRTFLQMFQKVWAEEEQIGLALDRYKNQKWTRIYDPLNTISLEHNLLYISHRIRDKHPKPKVEMQLILLLAG